jgi:hypothetical protein
MARTTGLLIFYDKCVRAAEEASWNDWYDDDYLPAVLDRADAARERGRMHPAHAAVGAEVYVAHGRWSDKPEPSAALHGHILTQVLCIDPRREAEWDAWYDDMHVPDMLSCGAFSAMTRWQRAPRPRVGAGFLTLYDVATATVDESVARSADVLAEIIAAGRKLDTHTGGLTVTLQPTGAHPGAGCRR